VLFRHVFFTLGYISLPLLKLEVRSPTLLISQKTLWFGTTEEEVPSSDSLNRPGIPAGARLPVSHGHDKDNRTDRNGSGG
ncbi:hypothetical protein LINPERPRIM_LOCUS13611, partial [Linum perenne]